MTKPRRLGEILIELKLLTPEQLEHALAEQRKTGQFLGAILIRLGFVTEAHLLPVLSDQLGLPSVLLSQTRIDPEALKKIPAKFATHYRLMPVLFEPATNTLTVAIADPLNIYLFDELKLFLKCEIRAVLASERDIQETIREHYGVGAGTLESLASQQAATSPEGAELHAAATAVENLEDLATDASIVTFVNQLLLQAHRERATDIHIEPFEDALRVRFRIDGLLHEIPVPPTIRRFQSAIISRLKIMAKLDIAERRLPQDGRIKVLVGGEELDLRLSVLPTIHGESVDLRLLSPSMFYRLEQLGLSPADLTVLRQLIRKPHGILFVTGPTGSGKTTTLYASLSQINTAEKKIITIEDPIEYQLKGVSQIQVHPKIGLTFGQGLRSMLRHDPDVMMVGEVRDVETAEITIRVALTGHLVFSTLHTNDAAGGVTRLLDMGIEPFLVASSVECFIAQRLVRLICEACKHERPLTEEIRRELGVRSGAATPVYCEGTGCDRCRGTGYFGRTAIYEFLLITDAIRELILRRTSSVEIKERAIAEGMRTLRDDGWAKIQQGVTTPAEVLRVTQQENQVGAVDD